MTYSAYSQSAARIVTFAMRDAGLLSKGQEPLSEDYVDGFQRLLDIINFEQTQGIKLWLQEDMGFALIAGQQTYSLGPTGNVVMTKPLRVLQGYSLNTSGTARPLTQISRDEWTRLSQKNETGAINSFFVDKQYNQLNVNLWLIPDNIAAQESLQLVLQQQAYNVATITELLQFPLEWFMFLRWALCADICMGQPQAIMDRADRMCAIYRNALEDWDVEDASTVFQIDSQGQTTRDGFR